MDILRDGKIITLTDEETGAAAKEHIRFAVHCEVVYILENQLDDIVSFSSWAESTCAYYASEQEALNDFIEECVTICIESVSLPLNDDIAFNRKIEEIVLDLADDYGYVKE